MITWEEWDGDGYTAEREIVYFSLGQINPSKPAIARDLVRLLQQDGIIDSLGEGFQMLHSAKIVYGMVTTVGEDRYLSKYDKEGIHEDHSKPAPATWVEMNHVE